jgi:hypothetical protein
MKTLRNSAAAGAVVAAAAALLGASGAAQATTVTFGTNPGVENVYHFGPTYTEQGYKFSSALDDLASWGNGLAEDPDPTDSVSMIGFHPLDAITLTREDGGAFDLTSIDFRGYKSATNVGSGDLNFSWVLANGGTGSSATFVQLTSWTTELLSLKGLKSFTWQPASFDLNFVWADNVVVSTTPIPAALPLFATALAGLGFLSRRKKAAAVTADIA